MKGVYKFYVNCGRQGSLSGVFIATKDEVAKAMGRAVYFDEPFGKYSEVEVTLDAKCITLVTDNPEVVKVIEDYDLSNGYNPLEGLEEDFDSNED